MGTSVSDLITWTIISCPCIPQAKPNRELASCIRDSAQISHSGKAREKIGSNDITSRLWFLLARESKKYEIKVKTQLTWSRSGQDLD